jgi:hypothetical protein
MKTKNPFSIVNRPMELTAPRERLRSSFSSALKKQSKVLAGSVERIPPGLVEALLSTSAQARQPARPKSVKPRTASTIELSSTLVKVTERAAAGSKASTVGILDLGAWVSRLPELLHVMNTSQEKLVFLELQTSVPAGLIKTKEPLALWAKEHLGRALRKKEAGELTRNMLADEFYYFAESVRVHNKLDLLIGLTPAMIAFTDVDGPKWNYYTAGQEQVSVVSTCDLREYSAKADRPYEAAIGMLIAAQIFALRNDMEYHPETRGCIFDFNEDRIDLVKSIRGMRIDSDCMTHFKGEDEAKAARQLVSALARMKESQRG